MDGNQCDVYVSHSTDGQTWGAWAWWGSCGDQIAVSVMPNGTAWALLRVPYLVSQHVAVKRYFNGSAWDNFWVFFPDPQVSVNDIDLLAYPNPGSSSKMAALAIGSGDCGLYYRDWNGTSWTNWALAATCFKQVSSFSTYTSDGGAYMLLIGSNNLLYTNHFTGSAWSGITSWNPWTWIAAAGVNIDDEAGNALEHTEYSDDCRAQNFNTCIPDPNGVNCWTTPLINLAEIIYNESQAETRGAQAMVGWTIRSRSFQSLTTPSTCGTYHGAEGGGAETTTCRNNVPFSDYYFPQERALLHQ